MKLTSFILKCKRVWHALKKPTKKEFWNVARIAAIGIGLLGIAGFLISAVVKTLIR